MGLRLGGRQGFLDRSEEATSGQGERSQIDFESAVPDTSMLTSL